MLLELIDRLQITTTNRSQLVRLRVSESLGVTQ